MVPIITLAAVTLLARLTGVVGVDALDWQTSLRVGFAAMFLLTGAVVAVTGVLEIAGAVGLLIPATAPAAAICLAFLLLAMFPANVSAARRGVPLAGKPATPLGIRTAEQILFIGLAVLAAL
jgi:uncharacterized membrane protein